MRMKTIRALKAIASLIKTPAENVAGLGIPTGEAAKDLTEERAAQIGGRIERARAGFRGSDVRRVTPRPERKLRGAERRAARRAERTKAAP